MTRVVSKAVLFDESGKVLLIRRSSTDVRRPLQWDVPGGAVDEGEDYVAGASREINEETGLNLDPNNLHLVYSTSDMTDKGNVVWIYFVARVNNFVPVLSSEHDDYQWVELKEVFDMLEYDRQITAIRYMEKHGLIPPVQ